MKNKKNTFSRVLINKFVFFCLIITVTGCSTLKGPTPQLKNELDEYTANKTETEKGFYESLYIEGERDAVLNFNRVGWLSLVGGDLKRSEWAFDQSLERIERIYANDEKAQEAKSKFSEEDVKDFKGEPYERAMAYYYRGILYLAQGDYENARATFKAGEFQDTLSEKEEFQSDFALLNYLQGWSSHCNGDAELANEAFNVAHEHNPALNAPDNKANFLLLFDYGTGPVKISTGRHSEILTFKDAQNTSLSTPLFHIETVSSDIQANAGNLMSENRETSDNQSAKEINVVLAENMFTQATTRGGRAIQGILDGKAQFKDTTQTLGLTSMLVGRGLTSGNGGGYYGSPYAGAAGAGLQLVGLTAMLISNATTPQADTRYWDTLPGAVYVGTTTLSKQNFSIKADLSDEQGVIEPVETYGNLQRGDGTCSFYYSTQTDPANLPSSAPGARLSWNDIADENNDDEMKAFRQSLMESKD